MSDLPDVDEPLIGAIDQGTSSTRFLIFSAKTGGLITYAQKEIELLTPHEGWAEQKPLDLINVTIEVMRTAVANLQELGFRKEQLRAIGITNQRETIIAWDRTNGAPLANAICWLDARTASLVERFVVKAGGDRNALCAKTGLPFSTYPSAPKIAWLLEHCPAVREARDAGRLQVGTVDSWLVYNLTRSDVAESESCGLHVTDVTNASRTQLFNIETMRWDDELCQFFGVPRSSLPEVRSSAELFGRVAVEPLRDVPIAGIVGDQQAALLGHGCLQAGEAKNTYGTGCFLILNTGSRPVFSNHGLLTTIAFQLGPEEPVCYALEGAVAIAGQSVRWLRDHLGILQCADEIEKLAASVDTSHGCYFVPAFNGLFCPYWRSDARGVICGLTQFTNKAHLARATLEAVCFQNCEILEAIEIDTRTPLTSMKVDGGMAKNNLLMQLQADLSGLPVLRAAMPEMTAYGAALAAIRGIGLRDHFERLTHVATRADERDTFVPRISKEERASRLSLWKKAVQRTLNWHSDNESTDDKSEAQSQAEHGVHLSASDDEQRRLIATIPFGMFLLSAMAILVIAAATHK